MNYFKLQKKFDDGSISDIEEEKLKSERHKITLKQAGIIILDAAVTWALMKLPVPASLAPFVFSAPSAATLIIVYSYGEMKNKVSEAIYYRHQNDKIERRNEAKIDYKKVLQETKDMKKGKELLEAREINTEGLTEDEITREKFLDASRELNEQPKVKKLTLK